MCFKRTYLPKKSDLDEIEAITQLQLTKLYKQYYLRVAGLESTGYEAKVEVTYPDGYSTGDFITNFVTVGFIRENWEHVGYLQDLADHFELDSWFVEPDTLVPIAVTADGCVYVSMCGKHADAVYLADNGDFGIARVADDLKVFLRRFDLSVAE